MTRLHTSLILLFCVVFTTAVAGDGYLGIRVQAAQNDRADGLRIHHLLDESAAALADMQENDLITHLNGRVVTDPVQFYNIMADMSWGDPITVKYMRGDRELSNDIILGKRTYTKTYEILKSEQIRGEVHWYFNDNTTLVMLKGQPQSITKKFEDGRKVTLDLTGKRTIPLKFKDLEDKLSVIKDVMEAQRTGGTDEDRITFIKEFTGERPDAIQQASIDLKAFEVYPNPSQGEFTLNMRLDNPSTIEVVIYDVKGQSVYQHSIEDHDGIIQQKISLPEVMAGTYLLYLRLGNQKITKQIIIQ